MSCRSGVAGCRRRGQGGYKGSRLEQSKTDKVRTKHADILLALGIADYVTENLY